MISTNNISAVICSKDLEKSQEFYEKKLGLKLSPKTIKNHLLFEFGDNSTLLIYSREAPNLADHTQVRIWSTDINADVKELENKGVTFEEYNNPNFKTVNHIGTSPGIGRSAWFKDPDSNTLAIFQPE